MSKNDFAEKYLKLKPITEAQKEYARKNAARNIYIMSKDGSGFCSRCEKPVLIKAKHKEIVKCPQCKAKAMIQHTWRMSENQEEFRFLAIPQVLDSETYVIRYVIASRWPKRKDFVMPFKSGAKGTPWFIDEVARIYGTEKYAQPVYYVRWEKYNKETDTWEYEWRQGRTSWFRPDTYSILCRNKHWVDYHDVYPRNLYRNLDKLDCFKYYSSKNLFNVKDDNVRGLQFCVRTARISEKLDKMGLGFLIDENRKRYWYSACSYGHTPWISGNKSVQETLNMNNWQLRLLRTQPTMKAYKYLQSNPTVSEDTFNKAAFLGFSNDFDNFVKEFNIKYGKTFQYIKKHANNAGDFVVDYSDYGKTLGKLGYPIDNQYLYPKDFRKADERVQNELRERDERRRNMTPLEIVKEEAQIDETIYKISKALMESKRLKLWMGGSQGLKVIVPRSAGELIDEGIKLHNCLKNYSKDIADKQALIFFIRKIDEPDKEYIAAEYRNGKIRQLRIDNNVSVKDEKIIQFADHLADELNKMDIINRLRRVV